MSEQHTFTGLTAGQINFLVASYGAIDWDKGQGRATVEIDSLDELTAIEDQIAEIKD